MQKVLLPVAVAALTIPSIAQAEAQAQDNTRFAVAVGIAGQQLGGDPLAPQIPLNGYPPGTHLDREDDSNGAALSLNWFLTPNIALEYWVAGQFDARTEIDVEAGPDVGVLDYETRPMSFSAQYHFNPIADRFKPFVGLGVHRTAVSGVTANRQIPQVAGITIGNGKGLAAMVGLDFAITPRVFARGDVRYLEWKSDIGWTAAAPAREADMDALIYGLSIGMRF
jgi:outer membrane protein W